MEGEIELDRDTERVKLPSPTRAAAKNPPSSAAGERIWLIAAVLVFVAGTAASLPFLRDAATRPSDGFIAYYTASRLVLSGRAAALLYDDEFFREQTKSLEIGADDLYYVNPPTTALVLLPLAGVEYVSARIVWTAVSFALLILAGIGVVWTLGPGGWRPFALVALPFFFQPLAANFEHGQMYGLVLALLAAAWAAHRAGRDSLLGVVLALLLLTKLAGLPLWLVLVCQRRFRPLAWAVGATAAMVAMSLPFLGVSSWPAFAQLLLGLGAERGLASPAYQSLPGLIRQLTRLDPIFSSSPLVDLPALGSVLSLLAPAGLLAITLAAARRVDNDLLFAAVLALSVIISPLSADYHYTVLLLPIAILLWKTSMFRWEVAVIAVTVWLIAADIAPRNPVPSVATFGSYARLAGGLLLWALALWLARSRPAESRIQVAAAGPG